MNLKHLTDDCLLKDTIALVKRERAITTELLHHLKEIESRKLFCDLRCSSLFDYCTRILGYSGSSAHRRIMAARLIADLPEIEHKIESGKLNLITIASASVFFKQENIQTPQARRDVLHQLENLNKNDCEKKLFEISGKTISVREEKKRISVDKVKVSMVLSDETVDKLYKIQCLLPRKYSNEALVNLMADIVIKVLLKKKFKLLN